jgi:hypothetical protein
MIFIYHKTNNMKTFSQNGKNRMQIYHLTNKKHINRKKGKVKFSFDIKFIQKFQIIFQIIKYNFLMKCFLFDLSCF